MINLIKITPDNRPHFENILGILPFQTHVLRSAWDVYASNDSTPIVGWDASEEYQEFEALVDLTNGERVVVISGEELFALTRGQGPLAPRGPGLKRGYAFAVITATKKTATSPMNIAAE